MEEKICKFLANKKIKNASVIVLIGVKHSGKSTIAKKIASQLKIDAFDIDEIIEKKAQSSVRDLYKKKGKDGFFQAEFDACEEFVKTIGFMQRFEKIVVATGGGICENEKAIEVLKKINKSVFVFLDVNEKTVIERILKNSQKTGSLPPYIARKNPKDNEEVKKIFHDFFVKRRKKYKKLANVVWKI
ncbi:MAG: AAA family ATPase [Treponema sp.]|nr:AAA family ATPase [Treponema sp.]